MKKRIAYSHLLIRKKRNYFSNTYFKIVSIISIAYWPILFCVYSIKWDAMNISVPWRHFIAQTILQKKLPLWYPNQQFGMGQYIDPQTWYWPSWVLSIFGYTNLTLHLEFMLHIYVAAIGCYNLCKYLKIKNTTALTMGLVYAMSGFFIGNAQHIGWIVSATWIPIVIHQFLAFIETLKWKNLIGLNLSLYLLITGGYWSLVIGTYYYLIFLFIFLLVSRYKNKSLTEEYIKKLLPRLSLLILLNILTTSVVLSSLYDSMNLISRGSMDIDFTLFGSFFPVDLLSLFAPIATYARSNNFWKTDVSLTNLYIGSFCLYILLWNITFRFKTILKQWKLVILILVITAFTMGETLPLRSWFSAHIPLFDHFRYPSAYRVYVILCLCIIIGIIIDKTDFDTKSFKTEILVYGCFLGVIAILIYIFNLNELNYFISNIVFKPSKFPLPLLFIIQLCLSSSLIIFFYSNRVKMNSKSIFRYFIIIELVITTQLSLPNTVVDISQHPLVIYKTIKKLENKDNSDFLMQNSIQQMDNISKQKFTFGNNEATYTNLISQNSYSSYRYKSTKDLINDPLYYRILQKQFAYLQNINDTLSSLRNIENIIIQPNYFSFSIDPGEKAILNISQNHHKHWQCLVNNSPTLINKANICLMKVEIPKEKSKVELIFKPVIVIVFAWISFVLFTLQIGAYIAIFFCKKHTL